MSKEKYKYSKSPNEIDLYTDASVSRDLDNGSIGVVMVNTTTTEVIKEYGQFFHENTTVNRMESIAAGCALKELYVMCVKNKIWVSKLTLYSDSEYLVNRAAELANNQEKADRLIVQHTDVYWGIFKMIQVWGEKGILPEFKWIRSHNGNTFNNRADSLAKIAREKGIEYLNTFGFNRVVSDESSV